MIHLDRVELLHWDIQPHQMIPFSRGVTIITGENGSGKTSILDAIKVGLGVQHPSAERRVEDYLLHQAKSLVMIRILVDNRRDPATGRRPFDPLGAYGQDVVTMAVVFKATDENEYSRDYYLLDGDQVPIAEGLGGKQKTPHKPMGSAAEYRERLKRVGIGPRYLKLLRLPQGQVAQLCAMNSEALFDYLFDIIGGRTVLERWEARLVELNERQRDHDAVQAGLKKARESLDTLGRKVDRYRDFEKYRNQKTACDIALPHRRLGEATDLCRELETQKNLSREALSRLKQRHSDALELANRASERKRDLDGREQPLSTALAALRRRHIENIEALATQKATLTVFDNIRKAAVGIPPEDTAGLHLALDALRADVAAGDAEQRLRDAETRAGEKELVAIKRGLLPLPEEVEAFRQVLRQAGIPHHVLSEVVEVTDDSWGASIEGYLGRLRFAILVQDPAAWQEAAALARRHRYSHGVLAPDVRGTSPVDQESLASIVTIKEVRYRSLLARLLRRVVPGEPPEPLSPSRGGTVHIARDGFMVSRMEARHAHADRLYLGRRALEARERRIGERQQALDAASAQWRAARAALSEKIVDTEASLERQRRRLEWENARDRFAQTQEQVVKHDKEVALLFEEIDSQEALLHNLRTQTGQAESDFKVAEERARSTQTEIAKADADAATLEGKLTHASERLGRLKLEERLPLSAQAEALARESSVEVLESMTRQLDDLLHHFREDEQDPMLPVNHQRQREETEQVASSLQQLQQELGALRDAAERAHEEYLLATKRVFRAYFARLKEAAEKIDFFVEGRLEQLDSGRFRCDVRVGIGDKTPVHHDSQQLSGGQKAALSILMGMTAVALEEDGAGFFVIDEPFSNSDLHKINELGRFLDQTGAQYLVSMPTTADLDQCGDWLKATWICTRCRGGVDTAGAPVLAAPLKICFAKDARRG